MPEFIEMKESAWPIARSGLPEVAGATTVLGILIAVALTRPGWGSFIALAVAFFLWLGLLFFFRDPYRRIVAVPDHALSPCDGRVLEVVQEREDQYLKDEVRRISVFLSPLNVHVQRMPLDGTVVSVDRCRGSHLAAFRPEAAETNAHIAMVLDTPRGRLLLKQTAGILARRCVNWARPGDHFSLGQRFGMIKLGSRVDLWLPLRAHPLVQVGDQVRAGATSIASFEDVQTQVSEARGSGEKP